MSDILYTLIVFKPSSEDYCKGCLMASYSSDHEFYTALTDVELIKHWSHVIFRNMSLDYREAVYEVTVMEEALVVYSTEFQDAINANPYMLTRIEQIQQQAQLEANQRKADLEIKNLEKKQQDRERENRQREKAERELFSQLRSKYD